MQKPWKVLVSDALAASGLQPLHNSDDISVDLLPGLSPADLLEKIGEYDALLVRSASQVTAEVIQAGKRLRVIGRAGVGVDNIDLEAATQAGVIVVNAPTGNTVAAAEHTLAMLMALARHIPQADRHVRAGQWKRGQFVGTELRGKTLGSVGLGKIANEVAQVARTLGMNVLATDPYVTPEYAQQRGVRLVDLDTLLAESDFLTLHTPLTSATRNMINAQRLASAKAGISILNVSRGGVIDEQALADAIHAGHVSGAALDVFAVEPLPADSPLFTCERVILTPHLGASTVEAQEKVAADVSLQVIDVLRDRPARYAVNAPILAPQALEFLTPYIDLAERMGRFLKALGAQGMGDVELTAHGQLAKFDSTYISAALIKGLLSDVVETRVNLVNALVLAERRGMNLLEYKEGLTEEARHPSMLTVSATSGRRRWTVRGSVLQGEPHIVAIDDLWLDFEATGNVLLTAHQDRPGIIGTVGTMLAEGDINISFMHVGRHGPRQEAIMALGTDEVPPAEMLRRIENLEDILWVRLATL